MCAVQTIYIDVLIGVNIYINYFLLLAAAFILHERIKRSRLCLGALTGALGCCVMFFDLPSFALGVAIKTALASLMVLAAFGFGGVRAFIFRTLVLTAVTFTLAGLMIAVKNLFETSLISVKYFSVYLDVSPVFLIFTTVVCYLLLTLLSRIFGKKSPGQVKCEVKIENAGRCACIAGFLDTGNRLTEPFSGFSVIIADRASIADITPAGLSGGGHGIRLVPYSSVGGSGLLSAFLPDSVTVTANGRTVTADNIYIAVTERPGSAALVNPDILS